MTETDWSENRRAEQLAASALSNSETALRNAVIGGYADALVHAGVKPEKIAEARAWVEAEKAAKKARKAAHVASGAEQGAPEELV